jgi:hypothetical protein
MYRLASTFTRRSSVRWTISVGTRIAGRTGRTSIWLFIRTKARPVPGLALMRT